MEESTLSLSLTLELVQTLPSENSFTSPFPTFPTMFVVQPSRLSASSSSATLSKCQGSSNFSVRVTTLMLGTEVRWLSVFLALELVSR